MTISPKYNLIIYKASANDYCRNCLMNSYHSKFECVNTDDEETVIDKIAQILIKDRDRRCGDAAYEIYLFYNGYQILPHIDLYYEDEYYKELCKAESRITKLSNDKFKEMSDSLYKRKSKI